MKKTISIGFFLILIIFSNNVFGEENKGKFAIGLNYPGFSVRYFKSDRIAWEAKLQAETNILVVGARLNKYSDLKNNNKIQIIKGLEFDLVSFKGETTEGYGIALEVFIGGEYSISKKLSFQLDIGPALVFLMDKDYKDVKASSLEFVLNLGVNYYIGADK
jgi:hypothetical protein